MPRVSEVIPCVDCNEEFPRKLLNRMGRCRQCALKAIGESATQLHNHSGPYYEKWKASMRNNVDRASDGIRRFLDEAKKG